MRRSLLFFLVVLTFISFSASAQITELGPLYPTASGAKATTERAEISDLHLSSAKLTASETHDLGPLSSVERQRLTTKDEARSERALKVGIERAFPRRPGFEAPEWSNGARARAIGGGLLETAGEIMFWTTAVRSPGANGIRLQIEGALPAGARAYIYAATGEVHGPYTSAHLDNGALWSNTVYADTAYLEVQILDKVAASGTRLSISSIAHIETPSFAGQIRADGTDCLVDASCVPQTEFSGVGTAGNAMAQLIFMRDGGAFVCSGGLLNNTRSDGAPYFLTANHCFSTQAAASSLEATWNYKTINCADPNDRPNRSLFPRSLGSTLLATGTSTDFTLVRLNQPPPGTAVYLGWNANIDIAGSAGTKLFRVHHPQGVTQYYARHSVDTTYDGCASDRPRGQYIFSRDEVSGTSGGSSGSPVMLENLQVVGQLFGACGPQPDDACDGSNRTVDGAFRSTFPSIQQFLAPSTTGPCVANSTTACMLGGRFQVTLRYRGTFDNGVANQNALVKPVTGFADPNFETSFFFFNSPNNIEMLVKLLDQGNTDSAGRPTIAVLFGSATPLRIELQITDTQTGSTKNYLSEFGQSRGGADFTAFVK
ncbi:MAG: hypothetical protein ABI718_16215 [Acidobacteriota bacterium]